jgi:hypothetical protein
LSGDCSCLAVAVGFRLKGSRVQWVWAICTQKGLPFFQLFRLVPPVQASRVMKRHEARARNVSRYQDTNVLFFQRSIAKHGRERD